MDEYMEKYSYYLINDILLKYKFGGKYWYIYLLHNNKKVDLYKIDINYNKNIIYYYINKICYNILKEINKVRNDYLSNNFNLISISYTKLSFNYFKMIINNTYNKDESIIYYSIRGADEQIIYNPKNNINAYISNSIDILEKNIKNHIRDLK